MLIEENALSVLARVLHMYKNSEITTRDVLTYVNENFENDDGVVNSGLYNIVYDFFDGDDKKTNLWFTKPNPLLGNIESLFLYYYNYDKLENFIKNCLDGNI